MSRQPLGGRCALVTGGAVRLGRALALRLAREGAHVGIHYGRSADDARRTLDELRGLGVQAAAVQADLSQDPARSAGELFEAACHELGPIDLLVNSAAIFEPGTLEELTPEQWRRHLAINLESPLWLSREFARRLPADRRGQIINILDWRAQRPRPGHLAYTIAKAGLLAATQILAQELGPRIQVNAIAPGAILPPPGAAAGEFARLADRNPLRRTGEPDDVADALVYLATSRFVTGEVLHVTGGEQL